MLYVCPVLSFACMTSSFRLALPTEKVHDLKTMRVSEFVRLKCRAWHKLMIRFYRDRLNQSANNFAPRESCSPIVLVSLGLPIELLISSMMYSETGRSGPKTTAVVGDLTSGEDVPLIPSPRSLSAYKSGCASNGKVLGIAVETADDEPCSSLALYNVGMAR